MMGSKWVTVCRVASGLWLLVCLTQSYAHAADWQDEPSARGQLHQLGLELALADVHPDLTLWWQQAVSPDTASDQADDRLLLGLQSFWRHWSSLSFNDRQYLRTSKAKLSFSELDKTNLQLADESGSLSQLVQRLTPGYGDHEQLAQQLTRLVALKEQPWPTLQSVTVRPNERHLQVVSIRERLQLLGDMPDTPEIAQTTVLDATLNASHPDQTTAAETTEPETTVAQPASTELELSELGFTEADLVAAGMVEHELNASAEQDLALSNPANQSVMQALSGSSNSLGISPTFIDPELYDADLLAGVKRFQARHGLTVDGVVGPQTYAWLNTSPLKRAQLLMRSMMRTLISDELPASYLVVNIPEYYLRLYQNQALVLESNVIVGQNARKTPVMASKITSVVFNPPWNVPRSILTKDILPKLYRDPGYLERQGFEVLDSSGTQLISREEWQTRLEEGGGFPYRLRQRPGPGNALGAYKFHLPNNDAIYLHDTPGRGLFARDSRAFSSGCVRVQGAEQLADWLVGGQLSSNRLAALKSTPETRWIKVNQALPLFMVYWPGWLGHDGQPHFRSDIYGFDASISSPFKAG
ncbi:L,D-transpeptidase family protein [Oceanisphaera sp. W20_SRM_FM3]|uniref:L,D-transpeptidase family protein n=1 Tax=Oceanisphaera sp. W20_SRM_FM3 TaxID=3240267 RepID=UPI003F9D2B6F